MVHKKLGCNHVYGGNLCSLRNYLYPGPWTKMDHSGRRSHHSLCRTMYFSRCTLYQRSCISVFGRHRCELGQYSGVRTTILVIVDWASLLASIRFTKLSMVCLSLQIPCRSHAPASALTIIVP